MDAAFLIFPIMLCFWVSFLCWIFWSTDGRKSNLQIAVTTTVLEVLFLAWWVLSATRPWEVDKEFDVTPISVNNQDGTTSQIVSFKDRDGKQITKNCNDLFGGVLSQSVSVHVVRYKLGNYLGLSYGFSRPNGKEVGYHYSVAKSK